MTMFWHGGIAELAVGNIVRRVLYIIREEELSLQAGELTLSSQDSDREIDEEDDKLFLSSAATYQRILHPPSLATLLGSKTDTPPACHPSASRNHDIEGKGKFELSL